MKWSEKSNINRVLNVNGDDDDDDDDNYNNDDDDYDDKLLLHRLIIPIGVPFKNAQVQNRITQSLF